MMKRLVAAASVLLLAVLGIILASACAEAPASVIDEISDYNAIEKLDGTVERLPLGDVLDRAEPKLSNNGQLIMEGVIAQLPESGAAAHTFELNFRRVNAESVLKEIAFEQFPDLYIDAALAEDSGWTYYAGEHSGCLCDGKRMIRIEGLMGYIRFLRGASLEYCDPAKADSPSGFDLRTLSVWSPSDWFAAERIISLHSGETMGEGLGYELADGYVKVEDAMAVAQAFLNSTLARYEEGAFTYRIRKIYIRKLSGDRYGYEFSAERLYNGIPVDSTPLNNFAGADVGPKGYYVENGDPIYIWMIDSQTIDYFYCGACRRADNSEKSRDEILTLPSAIAVLSNTLTASATFDISSVELLYINGYYADDYLVKYTDEDVERYLAYPKETRLVWAFLLPIRAMEHGTLEYPHDPHYSFFVDAVTGEVIGFYDRNAEYVY